MFKNKFINSTQKEVKITMERDRHSKRRSDKVASIGAWGGTTGTPREVYIPRILDIAKSTSEKPEAPISDRPAERANPDNNSTISNPILETGIWAAHSGGWK